MIHIRFIGHEDYCEVFGHGFLRGEWVDARELTEAQVAKLAGNGTFEVGDGDPPIQSGADPTVADPVRPDTSKPVKTAPRTVRTGPKRTKSGSRRAKGKPRGRPFAKRVPEPRTAA